jgi:hypothetical protein
VSQSTETVDTEPSAFEIASSPQVVRLALKTSLFIGSLLNLINQGDAIFGASSVDTLKLCLTYTVPYLVATYSATSITLQRGGQQTS